MHKTSHLFARPRILTTVALSPSIPTSFVPKQPLDTSRRKQQGGNNLFLLIALMVLGVSVITAGAVFGYQKYLESVIKLKEAQLASAQEEISSDTVEEYIRLEERFDSARALLDNHLATSQFFTVLEEITLKNVRFDNLSFVVADDRTAKIELNGTARNFNTLAAQSNAVAADKNFKRAIFSGISLNPGGSVGFTLSADISPELMLMHAPEEVPVVEPAPAPEAAVPAATTTAATTTKPAATSTKPI